MKKTFVFAATAALLCACTTAGCGTSGDLSVYAPDGAPALALAKAIRTEEMRQDDLFDFDIVDSSRITGYVTGERPRADLCILPVNQAAKTLGDGTQYTLMGTVTNGNLYFLSTDGVSLTRENMKETLAGKKVGVVQLKNVPGLTLQVVLKDLGIDYRIAQSATEETEEGKVSLIPFDPTDITPAGGCDYYLCPEPAASAKIKGTAESPKPFQMAGDLQQLYGGGGYPQAVLVVKKSVLKKRRADVDELINDLKASEEFLESAEITEILHLLAEEREDGVTPSFNQNNLTHAVISRCGVHFRAAADCKDEINGFLQKLIEVNAESTALPSDGFYDMG